MFKLNSSNWIQDSGEAKEGCVQIKRAFFCTPPFDIIVWILKEKLGNPFSWSELSDNRLLTMDKEINEAGADISAASTTTPLTDNINRAQFNSKTIDEQLFAFHEI